MDALMELQNREKSPAQNSYLLVFFFRIRQPTSLVTWLVRQCAEVDPCRLPNGFSLSACCLPAASDVVCGEQQRFEPYLIM